jgi:hypothetical protein
VKPRRATLIKHLSLGHVRSGASSLANAPVPSLGARGYQCLSGKYLSDVHASDPGASTKELPFL